MPFLFASLKYLPASSIASSGEATSISGCASVAAILYVSIAPTPVYALGPEFSNCPRLPLSAAKDVCVPITGATIDSASVLANTFFLNFENFFIFLDTEAMFFLLVLKRFHFKLKLRKTLNILIEYRAVTA